MRVTILIERADGRDVVERAALEIPDLPTLLEVHKAGDVVRRGFFAAYRKAVILPWPEGQEPATTEHQHQVISLSGWRCDVCGRPVSGETDVHGNPVGDAEVVHVPETEQAA